MSLFISFEGGEGSGKTTQARLLQKRLSKLVKPVVLLREPGSTRLGNYLRRRLKGDGTTSPGAELFLFAAARAELVAETIQPLLNTSTVIIIDRFADSTLAYQGYGRGLRLDYLRVVNELATQGISPNLTILLDLPPEEGLRRTVRRPGEESQRRFERESLDFHRRVRKGYLELASKEPGRWFVVDGTLPKEKISELILQRVSRLLEKSQPA